MHWKSGIASGAKSGKVGTTFMQDNKPTEPASVRAKPTSATGNGNDFAFLRVPGVGFCVGRGPFREEAVEPEDGELVFYANDFQCADPRPWKRPERAWVSADLGELVREVAGEWPEIVWDMPSFPQWENVFGRMHAGVLRGDYQKIVPAVVETGHLRSGQMEALVSGLPDLPDCYWTYGYRVGDRGLLGATPERLFSLLDGEMLETMALAATAPVEREAPFRENDKEIVEHEMVADYLCTLLQRHGEVERGEREVLHLGSLVHFQSAMKVRMARRPSVTELILEMHPTPALGVLPRSPENLESLQAYRDALGVPRRFGAPFGVYHEGNFHGVVGIRHICWRDHTVLLPSGCGIIAESQCEQEWRELALKRESVKRLFGI